MKTKTVKEMLSNLRKILDHIIKWSLPKADYLFSALLLVCLIIFKPIDKIILGSYVVTLLLIIYFVKYKKAMGHKYSIVFLIIYFLLAFLGIGTIIYNFNADIVSFVLVEGSSMEPNIHDNDVLYVEKTSSYERGDIVIYDVPAITMWEELFSPFIDMPEPTQPSESSPSELQQDNRTINPDTIYEGRKKCSGLLIGRIIGFPTEKIAVGNGDVFINDIVLSEPYVASKFSDTYTVDYLVPVGSYFILQDHRDSSCDSTEVGGIPKEQIRGKELETFSPDKGMFEQKASAWFLILMIFLLPIFVSRRVVAPKMLRIFMAQYNLFCFFIFSVYIVATPISKIAPNVISVGWHFPSNFSYQIGSWIKYLTEVSPFSVLINLALTLIGVSVSIMEIKDYIDKMNKHPQSKG